MKKISLILICLFISFEVKSMEMTISCNMKKIWVKNFNGKVKEESILKNKIYIISSNNNFFGNTKDIDMWKRLNSVGSSVLKVTKTHILHEWTSDFVSCNQKSECSKNKLRHELNRFTGELVYEIEDHYSISKEYGICVSTKGKKF